ncbi:hypothetical protein N9K05_03295 [Woeseiaceae bacterium]|nr:hypothetical protein [Woeseiaceae bacterium]
MNIKEMDRDSIKSQLIEGLKHTKKVLKKKKGKVNRDLLFTVGDMQFLITRQDGGFNRYSQFGEDRYKSAGCFNSEFGEERDQAIKEYLDAPITGGVHGSKSLSMWVVNGKEGYGNYGLGIPSPNRTGCSLKELDLLISDAISYVDRHMNEIELRESFTDQLVRTVENYLNDDYLEDCYAKNRLFYDEYYQLIKKVIFDGWKCENFNPTKEELLTEVGKKKFFNKFISELKFDSRGYYSEKSLFDIDEHHRMESDDFKKGFQDEYVRNLVNAPVVPTVAELFDLKLEEREPSPSYIDVAWMRVEKQFADSKDIKKVA